MDAALAGVFGMSIRDRIARVLCDEQTQDESLHACAPCPECRERANAILAACPEIAALDHAREGWQCTVCGWVVKNARTSQGCVYCLQEQSGHQRVVCIPVKACSG